MRQFRWKTRPRNNEAIRMVAFPTDRFDPSSDANPVRRCDFSRSITALCRRADGRETAAACTGRIVSGLDHVSRLFPDRAAARISQRALARTPIAANDQRSAYRAVGAGSGGVGLCASTGSEQRLRTSADCDFPGIDADHRVAVPAARIHQSAAATVAGAAAAKRHSVEAVRAVECGISFGSGALSHTDRAAPFAGRAAKAWVADSESMPCSAP